MHVRLMLNLSIRRRRALETRVLWINPAPSASSNPLNLGEQHATLIRLPTLRCRHEAIDDSSVQ